MCAFPTSSYKKDTTQECIKHIFIILADGGGTWIDPCNLQKGQPLRKQNCDMLTRVIIIISTTEPCNLKLRFFFAFFVPKYYVIHLQENPPMLLQIKILFTTMGLVWKQSHILQPMQLFKHVFCYFFIFSYGWCHNAKLIF
jgi:hypothetical protein